MTDPLDPKFVSPVGWYLGSYVLRFIELQADGNDDPDKRFLAWENTVIVKSNNIQEAYDKVVAIGLQETQSYDGGPKGDVPVQWSFEGLTKLLPIYEDLEDGSEILWSEYTRKLRTIRKRIKNKDELIH